MYDGACARHGPAQAHAPCGEADRLALAADLARLAPANAASWRPLARRLLRHRTEVAGTPLPKVPEPAPLRSLSRAQLHSARMRPADHHHHVRSVRAAASRVASRRSRRPLRAEL